MKEANAPQNASQNALQNVKRLESWKAIATFLSRDERTVRRWASELALPVYRQPGKTKGRVFAYSHELTQWLHAPKRPGLIELPEVVPDAAIEASPSAVELRDQWPGAALATDVEGAETETVAPAKKQVRVALLMLLAIIISVGGFSRILKQTDRAGRTAAAQVSTSAGSENASGPTDADDLYLKGRYYWSKRTPASLQLAAQYFTQATLRNPNDARAYAGLADSYTLLREYSSMPDSQAFPLALAAAKRAVELDDGLAAAHASLAFISYWWQNDEAASEHEFQRAIALDPNNIEARHWHATVLSDRGHETAALAEIDRARALDPTSTSIMADKGQILVSAGRFQEAIALLKAIETTEPAFVSPHRYLATAYLVTGAYPNYLDETNQLSRLIADPVAQELDAAADQGYAAGGGTEMLRSLVRTQLALYEKGSCFAYEVGGTFALLGDNDKAFKYLNISRERHDPGITGIRGWATLLTLHTDPRYRKLLVDLGLSLAE